MLTLPSMFLIIGVTVALLLGVCSFEYCEDTEKIVVVFGVDGKFYFHSSSNQAFFVANEKGMWYNLSKKTKERCRL